MNKTRFISFIISTIYVLLGTIVVMVSFPKYEMMGFDYNHPLWTPLMVITFPVNVLSFGLVMVDNSIMSIVILQTIVLCVFWFVLYKILIRKSRR